MSKKKQEKDRQVRRALGLFTQLGFAMAACILVGVFLGRFLDTRLGTSPWLLLVCAFLGAAAAFKVLYDLAMKEWF